MIGGATTVGAGPVSGALGSFFFSSAAVGPTNNALAARAARIRIDIRFLRDSGPEGEPLREVVRGIAKGGKTCQWRPALDGEPRVRVGEPGASATGVRNSGR